MCASAGSSARAQLAASCTVTAYGAKGDNRTEDTHAVQAALDGCDTVVFPAPGRYLIRPVFLRHNDLAVVVEHGLSLSLSLSFSLSLSLSLLVCVCVCVCPLALST